MKDLDKCPFCGGEATMRRVYDKNTEFAQAVCTECGATGQRVAASLDYCAVDLAAEAWNRRADNGN